MALSQNEINCRFSRIQFRKSIYFTRYQLTYLSCLNRPIAKLSFLSLLSRYNFGQGVVGSETRRRISEEVVTEIRERRGKR